MKFYNDIFQKAWEITRHHKVLWWFGFFTLLWGGKGVELEHFFSNVKLMGNEASPFNPRFWEFGSWAEALHPFIQSSASPGIIAFIFVVLGLFIVAIMVVSQIGLVDSYSRLVKATKRSKKYSLDDAIRSSEKHFWSVLGINLIGKGVSYGFLILAALPLFMADLQAEKFLYSLALYLAFTPVAILVSLLTKYAVNYAVLKNEHPGEAIANAWNLFVKNIGTSLEMIALMFFAFVCMNMAAMVFAALVTLPVFLFGVFTALQLNVTFGMMFYYLFVTVVGVISLVFAAIVFSTWHYGSWTLLFLELTKQRQRSKTHRIWRK